MKNNLLFIALSIAIAFTSCNQVKLDTNEAEGLIKKTLELPKSYRYDVGWGQGVSMWGAGGKLDALQNDGLITWHDEPNGWEANILYVNVTEKGKPYFMGKNGNVYSFKIHDIDFNQITGVSIEKETKTATVRFTLKATNITPIALALNKERYINYSLDNPLNGELVFKLFDNGWQLLSNENKSSGEMVNQILNSDK